MMAVLENPNTGMSRISAVRREQGPVPVRAGLHAMVRGGIPVTSDTPEETAIPSCPNYGRDRGAGENQRWDPSNVTSTGRIQRDPGSFDENPKANRRSSRTWRGQKPLSRRWPPGPVDRPRGRPTTWWRSGRRLSWTWPLIAGAKFRASLRSG